MMGFRSRRIRSTLFRCALAVGVLTAGCGGPPSPEPAGPSPNLRCPLPMAWKEGEERPRRLRMTNGTDVRVSVWLDNCDGHTRLGDVPAGRTFLLPLPNRLIPFGGQLHLHVYDQGAMYRVGSYAVGVEPRWTLPLEVTSETPTITVSYTDEDMDRETLDAQNGFVVSDGQGFSFVARWAQDTPAVLTWQCTAGEAKMTLTHRETPGDMVPVEVRSGADVVASRGEWSVYRGSGVMLRAPAGIMSEVTETALGADSLVVFVGKGSDSLRHTFDMGGFRDASRVLGCFGLAGGQPH